MFTSTFAPRITALALFTLMASVAQAQAVVKEGVLTDATGRTLYTFDKDQANKSNCAGGCLQAWPAYVAEVAPGAKLLPGLTRFEQNGTQHFVSVALSQQAEVVFKDANELAVSIERVGVQAAQPSGPFVYRGLCGKVWQPPKR